MHARWTSPASWPWRSVAIGPSHVVQRYRSHGHDRRPGPFRTITGARGVNGGGFAVGARNDGVADFGFTQQAAPLDVPLPARRQRLCGPSRSTTQAWRRAATSRRTVSTILTATTR